MQNFDDSLQQTWEEFLQWSEKTFSSLPWRQQRSFYSTLVSEIMLQQTTVKTVVSKFKIFMQHYPTWSDLQKAQMDDVLKLWNGLGYYQRARRLKSLVDSTSQKNFQKNLESQHWLGIGPYTKNALLSIGTNQPVLAIDANLKRILQRWEIDSSHPLFQRLFESFTPRQINESMMDLGRVYCTARQPDCQQCPFKSHCPSAGKVFANVKPRPLVHVNLVRFIVLESPKSIEKDATYFGEKRSEKRWLTGFIELPTFILGEASGIVEKQYPYMTDYIEEFVNIDAPIFKLKSSITHYRIDNLFFAINKEKFFQALNRHHIDMKAYQSFQLNASWSSLTQKILTKSYFFE